MRFDLLEADLEVFSMYFPKENYDVYSQATQQQTVSSLEGFLVDGWNSGTGVKLNFFEALCFLRFEDVTNYEAVWSDKINEHDITLSCRGEVFSEWVCDSLGRFDIERYASGIYNLPIRVVTKLNSMSANKHRQARYVKEFIDKYTGGDNE
jgi:hypothetical protein